MGKLTPGVCPVCGSREVEVHEICAHDAWMGEIYESCGCPSGHRWTETFTLTAQDPDEDEDAAWA